MKVKTTGDARHAQKKSSALLAKLDQLESPANDMYLGSNDSLVTDEDEDEGGSGKAAPHESGERALLKTKPRKAPLLPRKPRAKLDASRILGENGFPVLMARGSKLRFKGKGHEAEDLKRLVSFYRDWAHGLFPKYPFKDVIKTVERKCRTRQMHICMEQWFMDWKRGTPVSELARPISLTVMTPTDPLADAMAMDMLPLGPLEAALTARAEPADSLAAVEINALHPASLSQAQLDLIEERKALALKRLEEKRSLRLQEESQAQSLLALQPVARDGPAAQAKAPYTIPVAQLGNSHFDGPSVDAQLDDFSTLLKDAGTATLHDEFV